MSTVATTEMNATQIKAYVAWVNAQLRKQAGTRPVEDLNCDMRDGVALANLIRIVAGVPMDGIYEVPSSTAEMVHNVEHVIQFMTNQRIRMHHTTATDIVEGNLKSIMRLILALAAHFKPNSVKQSAAVQGNHEVTVSRQSSVAGLAHGAATALADARRDAAASSHRPRRPRQLVKETRPPGSGTGSDSDHSLGERVGAAGAAHVPTALRVETGSLGSSPTASTHTSPRHHYSPHAVPRRLEFSVPKSKSQDFVPGHEPPALRRVDAVRSDSQDDSGSEGSQSGGVVVGLLQDEHQSLSDEMVNTKRALIKLQELLLSGTPPDGEESNEMSLAVEAASPQEEVVIVRSHLQQMEEKCASLREELSHTHNECMQLQGIKAGLQQRLSEQENAFLTMKAELLRAGFTQQSLENSKADLEHRLVEKDRIIQDLRRELARREREYDEIRASFQVHEQEKDATSRALKGQIQDLHDRLKRVGETEVTLSARVASQDRKMARLENKILHTSGSSQCDNSSRPSSARSVQSGGSDDLQLVRDSLRSLRTRFPGDDPQHQTIDTLEQSISSLMDRLQVTEQSHRDSGNDSSRRVNFDSTGDIRRSPITGMHGFPVHNLDNSMNNGNGNTKLLYFTDRTVTPFMVTLPKRLGEITLRDIKGMTERQGSFRYHFKAMDPEFGTVKEEITHDDDVIPGWEGKIVAWIEEDHG